MTKFIFIFSIMVQSSFAQESLCDILKLPSCESVSKLARRSSGKSMPSATTATQFNPANVSHDRGVGIETFYQSHNSLKFGLVTGTGRTGAALVNANMENTFFGNRIVELDQDYLERRVDKYQYRTNKYALALGAGLIKTKKIGFDLGFMGKYNPYVRKLNPGAGLALRLGPLTLGGSYYKDDIYLKFKDKLNYRTQLPYNLDYTNNTYKESFNVQTLSVGFKWKDLYLDWGQIKSHSEFYDDDIVINIFSSSFIWKKFLLNYALRSENTPAMKYRSGDLKDFRTQNAAYGALQFSLNKFTVIGVHYNYYLLGEFAGSVALFF
jgi:hypothetical protein